VRAKKWWRVAALFLVLAAIAAACGSDDDDSSASGGDSTSEGSSSGDSAEIDMGEPLDIAEGTTLDLPNCPSDWDPEEGLTDDTIKIAMSLPESGPVAALGTLDDGMRAWFEQMEPIDGRSIEVVSRDDAYDPARTLTNTQEMLETDKPFAFTYMIGSPNNLAIRDLLQEDCVPQLFNSTGLPNWGDPENYPWTIGGQLGYKTEARMWCNYISENISKGATVAGLFMDNDFGKVYQAEVEACDKEGLIKLVKEATHDPATPDVKSQITTLVSANADAIVLGTTGAPCPQSMAALAGANYQGMKILSYTCQGIAAYFKPVDPAGEGVLVATAGKDAAEVDDPEVAATNEVLKKAGVDPTKGSYFTGAIFARNIEGAFRQASAMEGGLNRVNMMRAIWKADWKNPLALNGASIKSDGVNDAYLVEAARFAEYHAPTGGAELGTYEFVGDLIDVQGQTGSVTKEGGS